MSDTCLSPTYTHKVQIFYWAQLAEGRLPQNKSGFLFLYSKASYQKIFAILFIASKQIQWICLLIFQIWIFNFVLTHGYLHPDLYSPALLSVASVSVRFRRKERGTRKDRAKNGTSKRAGRAWGRKERKRSPPTPPSFFSALVPFLARPKTEILFFPNENACYAS